MNFKPPGMKLEPLKAGLPLAAAAAAGALNLGLNVLFPDPTYPVRYIYLFLLVLGTVILLARWALGITRAAVDEIALLFLVIVLCVQACTYFPIPWTWLIILESVVFIGFHLFRPALHALPAWSYLLLFNYVYIRREGVSLREYGLGTAWALTWLIVLALAHRRYFGLTRRVMELAGELTRLRTGSEWFARKVTDPDRSGGVARELDAHAADAFAHFERWWRNTLESYSPLVGLSSSATYRKSEDGELVLISAVTVTGTDPRWRSRVSSKNPDVHIAEQEQHVIFGNVEWSRRHLPRWVQQLPLNLSGMFLAPLRGPEDVDGFWVGICQRELNEALKEGVRWLTRQVQRMADLHAAAFSQQDRLEILKKIHTFSHRISEDLNVSDVMEHYIQFLRYLLPFDGGLIALSPLEDEELQLYWSDGFTRGVKQSRARIPRRPDRSSWTSWIMQHREEIIRVEVKGSSSKDLPIWSAKGPQPPWSTILGIPLRVHQESIGITVIGRIQHDFRADEIQWVAITATAAALALRNAQLYERMEYRALRDGLTGVFNHRAFQEKLKQLLHEAREPDATFRELSLAIFDIDHFKQINDTYGHPFGDQVLKKVSGVIQRTVRHYDIVARYGGEEFAVLLPGCDTESSLKVAEEIRTGVESLRIHRGIDSIRVTVSGGVAGFPRDARNRGELIERADAALYHAKRRGRNQVWHWRDLPLEPEVERPASPPQRSWWRKILRH